MKASLLLPFALLAACGDDGTATPDACDPTIPNTICTIAGSGKNGYEGDDGPALAARMSLPQDTLLAPDGTLYILDWNNHRIRSLPGDGTIRHVAGRGELGGTLDDPANDDFNHPTSILLDASGTKMTVAAWHNSKLREIDIATSTVKDSCGDGRRAYFGDGGPALTATLDLPASLARSPGGDLVVMDQANQVLRKIDATGTITRLAGKCVIDAPPPTGGGPCATGVDPVACPGGSGKFTCGAMATCGAPCTPAYAGDEGPAIDMRMGQPFGQSADPAGRIAYDKSGNLYFADTGNQVIRKIDTAGVVHRVAGTPQMAGYAGDGGPALAAKLSNPVDLAFGADGTLYFTDVYNHCVRAIAQDQTIRSVAGVCGQSGYDGDGASPLAAHLKRPYGLEVENGVLYISDTGNAVIRSVVLP